MERLIMWLDDCDDLLVVFRVQGRAVIVTALLAVAFAAGVGLFMLVGAPDLLAAHQAPAWAIDPPRTLSFSSASSDPSPPDRGAGATRHDGPQAG